MENLIVCNSCKARLKVPATLAPGKKVKCPKCSQLVTVPGAVSKSATPVADTGGYALQEKTAAKPAITLAPATKGCPFCGEQVLVNAVKCRHCGEFFDAEAASAVKRVRDTSASADRLNPAEYVVAIVAGPVGLVIGVVWKFKKLRKALDMLKISGLSCVIVLAIALTLKFYVFTSNPRPSEVAAGSPFPYYSGVPGAGIEDNYPPDIAQSGAVDMPPDLADLEQQPPEIRRAMKANVRITQQGGLGSGVIVRQEKNRALILTNRHVVDYAFAQTHGALQVALSRIPEPDIMYVTRENKKGKVIWLADDEVDLAIVDAPCPDGIEAVVWQATQEIQIGEQVFAVGNPMGLGWTFTRGVVSAMRQHEYGTRKVPVLQTDTRIGPGNSGGGLYNQRGELIGINTFVVSASQLNAGESGLGFAIRKNVLLDLKPDMMQSPSTPPTP